MTNNIILLKEKQRKEFTVIRKKLNENINYKFKPKIIDQLLKNKKLNNVKIISSFFSIKTEMPTRDLNDYLMNKIYCYEDWYKLLFYY